MSYRVGGDGSPDSFLLLFSSAESCDGTAMFFAGGPVWAMDWLSVQEDHVGEQYVALTAYQDYDEVRRERERLVIKKGICGVVRISHPLFSCMVELLNT